MQSLSTNQRAGLALPRPAGQTKRSLMSKAIKPALPHAKGSQDNFGVDVSGKHNGIFHGQLCSINFQNYLTFRKL
jgi:hypothetical protein